jgi:hypothetical protein
MLVNGCDCSIVIKTTHIEKDIPYSNETLREAVSFLQEKAFIEGDGFCRGIRKISGVTGCVVTPLFISKTKNLFKYELYLLPTEETEYFDLIQDRTDTNEQLTVNNGRKLYEGCKVTSFELRVMRGEAVKLKFDISSERSPVIYPYTDTTQYQASEKPDTVKGRERFNGDCAIVLLAKLTDKSFLIFMVVRLCRKNKAVLLPNYG